MAELLVSIQNVAGSSPAGRSNMKNDLNKTSDLNVAVVGDVIYDQYLFTDPKKISDEAPVLVLEQKSNKTVLGGAGNVAANVSGLGANVDLYSVLPSSCTPNLFQDHNISISGCVLDMNRPANVKMRIIAGHQQVVRIDNENTDPISGSSEDQILSHFKEKKYDAILISDYNKGIVTDRLAEEIIHISDENKTKVFVDTKNTNWMKFHRAFCIKPNLKELYALFHMDNPSEEKIFDQLKDYFVSYLLLTKGSEGMTLYAPNRKVCDIKAHPVEVFDVSGAGDTVLSTFAICIALGYTLEDAVKTANVAAGIAVSKFGTCPINKDELLTVLEKYE